MESMGGWISYAKVYLLFWKMYCDMAVKKRKLLCGVVFSNWSVDGHISSVFLIPQLFRNLFRIVLLNTPSVAADTRVLLNISTSKFLEPFIFWNKYYYICIVGPSPNTTSGGVFAPIVPRGNRYSYATWMFEKCMAHTYCWEWRAVQDTTTSTTDIYLILSDLYRVGHEFGRFFIAFG